MIRSMLGLWPSAKVMATGFNISRSKEVRKISDTRKNFYLFESDQTNTLTGLMIDQNARGLLDDGLNLLINFVSYQRFEGNDSEEFVIQRRYQFQRALNYSNIFLPYLHRDMSPYQVMKKGVKIANIMDTTTSNYLSNVDVNFWVSY
ncbi:hypothetical protein RF11_08840 [Thelohanellus kitauei]|uniref:Uncharacterized protein n=1 Tax=Thelohanellus kitauei TaxID=669202 RepID=A0A0C2M3Y1_THEKT|nr:hypothetical protein RF11_08840 [Thelohanellus kitauei]